MCNISLLHLVLLLQRIATLNKSTYDDDYDDDYNDYDDDYFYFSQLTATATHYYLQ